MWKQNNIVKHQIPIKFWCSDADDQAIQQAKNLSIHPITRQHIALMPDCHVGYGMPIGGVIACENAVIPNAVGVDIGCGMIAVETNLDSNTFKDMKKRRDFLSYVKKYIPLGEGHSHKKEQSWDGFEKYLDSHKNIDPHTCPNILDRKNLGSLGGGNHFIELQKKRK